jgi:cold shock CspA family protein
MNLLKRRRFIGSGTIARLKDRGFGFISREGEEKDLFFHSNELRNIRFEELREGDCVGFGIIANSKGLCAVNIERNGRPDEEEVIDCDDSDPDEVMRAAVKIFTSGMAEGIARDPEVLEKLEWRDLERLIAEVFAGLGFDVELTPGSKDGGKDVIVSYSAANGESKSYFVEIKHWRSGRRVGIESVIEFLHVIARENKTGGILLATHGFAKNAIETITEIYRKKISFGTNEKVVGLCRNYVKASEGIWYPPEHLDKVIFEDTS